MFSLEFLGAAGTSDNESAVTGSKYFLRTATHRGVLIDCGLYQGPRALREKNWEPLPIQFSDIHNVILTHAHLDHTGYLPRIVSKGFRGNIFCTPATHEVTAFILRDSAKIQEEDAADANKHKYSRHRPALPLYDSNDVEQTLGFFHVVDRGRSRKLPDDLRFRFYNAGHILGSCFLKVEQDEKGEEPVTVLFSGDLGRRAPIYLNPKEAPPAADFLVCESTYGDRKHHAQPPFEEFAAIVEQVVSERRVLLVPAFAVDRAQELIYCLNALMRDGVIPEIPTYIDSPMATGVTALYEKYSDEHCMTQEELSESDQNPLSFRSLHFVRTPSDSKRLNNLAGPAIIISASGMATGGRIMHHLRNRLSDAQTLVLFTGFQAEGTLGRDLIEGADSVLIHGERISVRAEIRRLNSFSGHADQDELVEWMMQMPAAPRKVFLTHGEQKARLALKARIEQQLGWQVHLPRIGERVDLKEAARA